MKVYILIEIVDFSLVGIYSNTEIARAAGKESGYHSRLLEYTIDSGEKYNLNDCLYEYDSDGNEISFGGDGI